MGVAEECAPVFEKKPSLRQEDDGNRLVFECEVLSSPKPDIEWFRFEKLITKDKRTSFHVNSLGHNKWQVILDINDVAETDGGLYKIKAKNLLGEIAASINLNFTRK